MPEPAPKVERKLVDAVVDAVDDVAMIEYGLTWCHRPNHEKLELGRITLLVILVSNVVKQVESGNLGKASHRRLKCHHVLVHAGNGLGVVQVLDVR